MMPFSCTLSIEELAAAAALMGKREEAVVVLTNAFGQISEEKTVGMLLAGADALEARNLAKMTPDTAKLHPEITRIVNALLASSVTIRASRTAEVGESTRIYFRSTQKWFCRCLLSQRVSHFRTEVDVEDIVSNLCEFLGGDEELSTGRRGAVALPEGFLDLDPKQRRDAIYLDKVLGDSNPNNPLAKFFAQQMATALWRGAVFLLLDYPEPTTAGRIWLYIRGSETLWHIHSPGPASDLRMEAKLLTREEFRMQMVDVVTLASSDR